MLVVTGTLRGRPHRAWVVVADMLNVAEIFGIRSQIKVARLFLDGDVVDASVWETMTPIVVVSVNKELGSQGRSSTGQLTPSLLKHLTRHHLILSSNSWIRIIN